MKDEAIQIIGMWQVQNVLAYLFSVVVACLIVRIIIVALKAMNSCENISNYANEFWRCFLGFGSNEEAYNDNWHSFILGLFELSAFPVFMVTNHWSFIGAWFAFKTIAQWKRWSEKRKDFNRFLIGNALILFLSYLWLTNFITTVSQGN